MAAMRAALALTLLASLEVGDALAEAAPEPPPESVLAVLPFEAGHETNRVMVNLAPEGGRPFVMMLDTGASVSVITPRMARELGVRVRTLKDTPYRRATRLGRDLQFWVDTESSDTAARTGWEYGLLGGEVLDDYVVEIDFPGRRVRFLDPKEYEVPEQVDATDERVARLVRAATRVSVPIRVNGHDLVVMLDTGAPGTGILSGKAALDAAIDVAALPAFGHRGTVLGPMQTSLYEATDFALAGLALGRVPLLVAPKGWYNQAGPNDSVVGYDVLAPFVVRIDYARKRLWLKRAVEGPVRFYGSDWELAKQTGAFMNAEPAGHFVWAVAPGSAAEKLGIRAGDYVVSGERLEAPPADEVLRRILEGKELQVSRQQGELWVDTVLPEPQASD
jgi:predicted aspartyl protease